MYSKVIQLYMYLFFFKIFSHLGYCRVLNSDSKESSCSAGNMGHVGSLPGSDMTKETGHVYICYIVLAKNVCSQSAI